MKELHQTAPVPFLAAIRRRSPFDDKNYFRQDHRGMD
jgi:hypothetical protein